MTRTESEALQSLNELHAFVAEHERLFVLTGAGCSTESSIPDYRDEQGHWKNAQPTTYQDFMEDPLRRARYWARSMIGWRRFGASQPNRAHHALATLEQHGKIRMLVTQNVDRLHQAAGSQHVIDLHGRLDQVRCMQCQRIYARDAVQEVLEASNPSWIHLDAIDAPDGDARLEGHDFASFVAPSCPQCGGILKPDVVFFGESVPRQRIQDAFAALAESQAVLVVGSSLMVFSGFRFVRAAAESGQPVAAINQGRTRADDLLQFKVEQPCGAVLQTLVNSLATSA